MPQSESPINFIAEYDESAHRLFVYDPSERESGLYVAGPTKESLERMSLWQASHFIGHNLLLHFPAMSGYYTAHYHSSDGSWPPRKAPSALPVLEYVPTDTPVEVDLQQLRAAVGQALDFIQHDLGHDVINFTSDGYWELPQEQRNAFKPVLPDQEQSPVPHRHLSDDVKHVLAVLHNQQAPDASTLISIAALLRYVGDNT